MSHNKTYLVSIGGEGSVSCRHNLFLFLMEMSPPTDMSRKFVLRWNFGLFFFSGATNSVRPPQLTGRSWKFIFYYKSVIKTCRH